MAKQKYYAAMTGFINGVHYEKGEELSLYAQQAEHLLNAGILAKDKPKEAAAKPKTAPAQPAG